MCCLSGSDKNKGSVPGPLVGGHCFATTRAGERGAIMEVIVIMEDFIVTALSHTYVIC